MKKRFSRVTLGSLFFSGVILGGTLAVPVAQVAEAAVVDIEFGKYTTLENDYPVIDAVGQHTGSFTVGSGTLAELQAVLKGNKTAKIKIPDELVGQISATGDAAVEVKFQLDLTEIPLVDSLLTTTEGVVVTLAQLIDDQSILGLSTNLEEVVAALDAFQQLRDLNVSASTESITVSPDGKYMQVEFDDATVRFIADKVRDCVTHLQAAINTFEIRGNSTILAALINVALAPVKAIINGLLELIPMGASAIADFTKFIGDAAILKGSTVEFPTAIDVDMDWFQTNAPNGLTVDFLGTISEPSIFDFGFFETEDNLSPVVFADIVAPDTPIIKLVEGTKKEGFTLTVTAEVGSTVNVMNEAGEVIATATVPGTADGKTQADVEIKVAGDKVKNGEEVSVTATDAAGNVSDAAVTTLGTKITPVLIYRAYNPNSGEHLYTISKDEHTNVVSKGWDDEGTAWNASSAGTPVYRLYNSNSGEHFYTLSEEEYEGVAEAGWTKEGMAFYSYDEKEVDVFRVFNPNATGPGSHHYTTSAEERDGLVDLGWTDEDTAFYGMK